jgi:hypothetical protein
MTSRSLSEGEIALASSVFGGAIDYGRVRINKRKWWFLQPRRVAMAPDGELWFHPDGGLYCDDFSCRGPGDQGLFVHEMTHVWQHQRGVYLPLARHPFCRYGYVLKPGQPFRRYGLEQQAEIVRHAFLLREGHPVPGAPPREAYDSLLPF